MIDSIQRRMGALFLAFAALVIISVAASTWIIETQKQDALVINLAGRQRMLIQQMTKDALEIEKNQGDSGDHKLALGEASQSFDQTLTALAAGGQAPYLPGRPADIPPVEDPATLNALEQVWKNWQTFHSHLQTVIETSPQSPEFSAAIAGIEALSPQLVQQADVVVRLFETGSAQKVARLRWVQAIFFVSVLGLLAVGVGVTQKSVTKPLKSLRLAAQRIGRGDLETPVATSGPEEIANLARSFDQMRVQLKASQSELEWRVNQRTRELANAFEFSQEIVTELDLDRLLSSVTGRAQDLLRAQAASLCLLSESGEDLVLQASSGEVAGSAELHQPSAGPKLASNVVSADQTVATETACANCQVLKAYDPGQCVATPLRAGERTLGALCVVRRARETFDAEETRALSLLANSAATAITNANLLEAEQRRAHETATLAERERLAAELHDNLAQTLSFLNIKTDRLCEMVAEGQAVQAEAELSGMKSAINTAYGQVRAALVGLREPVTAADDDLATKLAASVDDLEQISDIDTEFTVADSSTLALPPVAQKQALHIVKEALNNARRHAQARRVWVRVERDDGHARFTVADDGRGFDPRQIEGHNHLGLTIMRARAERCGGSLQVRSVVGQGTEIVARLPLEN